MMTIRRDKCEEGHERQRYAVYMSFLLCASYNTLRMNNRFSAQCPEVISLICTPGSPQV